MIHIKTSDEVEEMRLSGRLLAECLEEVKAAAVPGATLQELDTVALKAILKRGATPSFKEYTGSGDLPPFPAHLCASVNQEVVHAPATRTVTLKEGDIVGLDIGLIKNGWHADMAESVAVGAISKEAQKLLTVTKEAMMKGIAAAKPGEPLSVVGEAVFEHVEKHGFGTVTSFVGHGIGRDIHEEPRVPNYPTAEAKKIKLKEGMVIAIEPMVTAGNPELTVTDDGWTAETVDKSLAAHFERTVAITRTGPEILTQV